MTDFSDISRPINVLFQRKLFRIANYYSDMIKNITDNDIKNSIEKKLYTSKKGYKLQVSDRYSAIVGRRPTNLCRWVNKIEHSKDRLKALKEYSTNHIAWIFTDELKNNPELITKFRTFINDIMDEEDLLRINTTIKETH
jgi:hypothetical protein